MKNNRVKRIELEQFIAQELQTTRFKDYCPNGLQVEGRSDILRIVTGVTASLALIERAIDAKADAILVHHGYFWRGEDARVIGQKHQRLKLLLAYDMSLFAYHLPLDAHPQLGNNAQLAAKLGLTPSGRFAEAELGWIGELADQEVNTLGKLAKHVELRLGRAPMMVGDAQQPIISVAWCTGAAQNLLGDAIQAGASVFLSGEISESTVHLARETGVGYLACGHHATERYGVQALGDFLAHRFGIIHQFIDVDNPV
jgi:dinuclear metal center YbgI/SA1388 family protein